MSEERKRQAPASAAVRLSVRALVAFGFIGVTVLFFLLTTGTFSGLTPYRLNSEIAAW